MPKGTRLRGVAPEVRFWTFVDVRQPDECWPWIGARVETGYGFFRVGKRGARAHRWVYEWVKGPIPDGLTIDHRCHSDDPTCQWKGNDCPHRRCCNPAHLEAVTHAENVRRASATCCKYGHEYTEANTRIYTYPDGHSQRFCRRCDEMRQPEKRARQRARRAAAR